VAVIKTGSVVADIRGSGGDQTYARNQGGLYVRARTGPTAPSSGEKQASINAMIALARWWSTHLTDQQRADWRSYAAQHPRPDRWGQPSLANGYNRFIAVNHRAARITGQPGWIEAPDLPHLPPALPTFTADSVTGNVTVQMPPPDWMPILYNVQLLAYWGRIVSVGVNFYDSFWSFAGETYGIMPNLWINDPWVLAYPGGLPQGKRLYVKFLIVHLATGAFSPYVRGHADIE